MKITTAKRPVSTLTPKAAGNSDDPLPLRVEIEPMGVAEWEAIRASTFGGVLSQDELVMATKLRAAIVGARVRVVHNLETDLDPAGGELPGEYLARVLLASNNAAHSAMFDEIYTAITDASKLAEGVAKN